ncbi:MAG TPA: cytochrome c biogenesis protein CcsA [Thermoanaerobaculia bacterium]|nr:cytochrome c biogenesis protein CcsA [Thermoanaerobaculia bacterium]
MRKILQLALLVLGWLVILGGFLWAPLGKGFLGHSSRILFFHVPMAWASFIAFIAAGVWSVRYLIGRDEEHDRSAAVAVELGLLFGVLATVTGAMWARTMWGAFWNWDPRQVSIAFALLFYAAYLALRSSIPDEEARRRLTASYAVLGLAIAPFLFFIAPRMVPTSLHPEPVINAQGKPAMESRMLMVLIGGFVWATALFFWLHDLGRRCARVVARREAPPLPVE